MEYVTLNNGVKMPMIGFGFPLGHFIRAMHPAESLVFINYPKIERNNRGNLSEITNFVAKFNNTVLEIGIYRSDY